MASNKDDHVLAVLSLSGGNDGLNSLIPYNEGLYRDYRPRLGIPQDKIVPLNDKLGFHPAMAALRARTSEARPWKSSRRCMVRPSAAGTRWIISALLASTR